MRCFFVSVLICSLGGWAAAQQAAEAPSLKTQQRDAREVPKRALHLYLGGGAALERYRDAAMSPLLYEGIQGAGVLGLDIAGPKAHNRVEGQFWLGNTSAARAGGQTENMAYAAIWGNLWRLGQVDSKWQWRAGPALSSWGSLRYHTSLVNSNYFYDLFFSLGPTGSVERSFRLLRRHWRAEWQLAAPVLSWGLRPTYSGLVAATPEDELTAAPYLEEAKLGTFGVLARVQSRLQVRYPLANNNALLLIYYWDVFRSDAGHHPVTHAINGLQLALSIKMTR